MPVRGLLHYALEVPDPTLGEKSCRTFGLVESSWITLLPGILSSRPASRRATASNHCRRRDSSG